MYRIVIIALPLVFFFSANLTGQAVISNNSVISGKVIDDSSGCLLSFVHIWNESTRMGGISNKSGEFNIEIKNLDTLVFSALGYSTKQYIVSSYSFSPNIIVRLKQKQYDIDEVVVNGIRTYESFKEEFLNLDLSNTKTEYLREHINILGTIQAIEADRERAIKDKLNGFGYTSSVGGGISNEKATEEKIRKLRKKEVIINQKFNRELVEDITQLKGNELTQFIASCNFSEEYLYKSDLYSIIEAISEKYIDYQRMITDTTHCNN